MIFSSHRGQFNRYLTIFGNGQIELGDLIGLWQVGIEIVLAVEFVIPGDVAVQGQARLGGKAHHRFVHHRQGAGHTGAHRAAVGVGVAAEGGGAGAEDLGAGGQLHMGFQADNGFPSHITSPPSPRAFGVIVGVLLEGIGGIQYLLLHQRGADELGPHGHPWYQNRRAWTGRAGPPG